MSKIIIKNKIIYSCIALATFTGFKIYSVHPFQLLYKSDVGPISIIEMLYKTNIILLVGLTEFQNFSPFGKEKTRIIVPLQEQVANRSPS